MWYPSEARIQEYTQLYQYHFSENYTPSMAREISSQATLNLVKIHSQNLGIEMDRSLSLSWGIITSTV